MKRSAFSLIALIIGIGVCFYAIMDSGGTIDLFISIPSLLVVLGGSFAAVAISYPLEAIKKIPGLFAWLIKKPNYDAKETILLFEELAQTIREKGALAIEQQIKDIEDNFLRRGIQSILDGVEAADLEKSLHDEMDAIEYRHHANQAILVKWGEVCPAFGMIGTVVGLVVMLAELGGDASSLGAGMAVALITTFYGSFFQNIFFAPVTENLKRKTEEEMYYRLLVTEGVILLHKGVNPRLLKERLMVYLTESDQNKLLGNTTKSK